MGMRVAFVSKKSAVFFRLLVVSSIRPTPCTPQKVTKQNQQRKKILAGWLMTLISKTSAAEKPSDCCNIILSKVAIREPRLAKK